MSKAVASPWIAAAITKIATRPRPHDGEQSPADHPFVDRALRAVLAVPGDPLRPDHLRDSTTIFDNANSEPAKFGIAPLLSPFSATGHPSQVSI